MLRVKPLSVQDSCWQNSREKRYGDCSNIKVHLSAHWRAEYSAKWPWGCREFQHPAQWACWNWTHVAWLTVALLLALNSNPYDSIGIYPSTQKQRVIWLVISCNLQQILPVQDCHSRISKVEYQGQTRNTKILTANLLSKHFVSQMFSVCTIFAQSSPLSSSSTNENLKFRTDLQDLLMDGCWLLISKTVNNYFNQRISQKLFKAKNRS